MPCRALDHPVMWIVPYKPFPSHSERNNDGAFGREQNWEGTTLPSHSERSRCNANPGAGGCTLAGPMYVTWNQLQLGQAEYQTWFCQQLGLESPCPARYAGQHCTRGRYTIDADHLHTCRQHIGNWYAAHEHYPQSEKSASRCFL